MSAFEGSESGREAGSLLRARGDGQPGALHPEQAPQELVDSPDEPPPELAAAWTSSTELLVAGLQNDEELAWFELYSRFSKPLQALIHRHLPASLRSHLATEDLFQSAMLRVRGSIGGFEPRGPGSFKAWLTQIIRNLIHSKARKEGSLPPELRDRQPATDLLDPASVPSEEAELAERLAHLTLTLAALPERHQEVLLLFLRERMNTLQIAERLEISERTARRIRAEAVAALERAARE